MLNYQNILKKLRWNATYEWFLVRFSGFLVILYVIYLLLFIFNTNVLTYEIWYDFFSRKKTKIINLITLLSIIIHGWIGISHVLVDYIKNLKLLYISKSILIMILFIYLFCGMTVIWNT